MSRLAVEPGYETLADVLDRALAQSQSGKGKERHGNGLSFEEQPIITINELLRSSDGALYQAMKKVQEAKRLPHDRKIAELLGAIVYVAAAVVIEQRSRATVEDEIDRTDAQLVAQLVKESLEFTDDELGVLSTLSTLPVVFACTGLKHPMYGSCQLSAGHEGRHRNSNENEWSSHYDTGR